MVSMCEGRMPRERARSTERGFGFDVGPLAAEDGQGESSQGSRRGRRGWRPCRRRRRRPAVPFPFGIHGQVQAAAVVWVLLVPVGEFVEQGQGTIMATDWISFLSR